MEIADFSAILYFAIISLLNHFLKQNHMIKNNCNTLLILLNSFWISLICDFSCGQNVANIADKKRFIFVLSPWHRLEGFSFYSGQA